MPEPGTPAWFWTLFQVPIRIVSIGLAVALLLWLWNATGMPGLGTAFTWMGAHLATPAAVDKHSVAQGVAALLVFLSGLLMVAFLWWLSGRYFLLVESGKIAADSSALRDSPLALPEGTVRAVLALIVALVGLPILLFSRTLQLDAAVDGYVNGIIAGVFGFYFGSRTTGVPLAAVGQIADARSGEAVAKNKQDMAEQNAGSMKMNLALVTSEKEKTGQALQASQADDLRAQLQRHASLLASLAQMPLPDTLSLTPLAEKITAAQALASLDRASPADLKAALDSLVAPSPLLSLTRSAAPVCAGGPALLAALLGTGWRLGSAEFQRWRTQVLGAPVSSFVVPFGALGRDEVSSALSRCPGISAAFAGAGIADPVDALVPLVLRDDAVIALLASYGPEAPHAAFKDEAAAATALAELQQAVLSGFLSRDITQSVVQAVTSVLVKAADRELTQAGALKMDDVLAAAIAAGQGGSRASNVSRAAFDALVTLVGVARLNKIDLPLALAEAGP